MGGVGPGPFKFLYGFGVFEEEFAQDKGLLF